MKKLRILKSLAAVTALAAPSVSMLTSCSRINYTEITETLKETMIDEFLQLCKVPRMTWMGHLAYEHIQDRMEEFGFPVPTGKDYKIWSQQPEVQAQILPVKNGEFSWLTDTRKREYWGEYGNIWYDLPATPGFESNPGIMIQAHYDMNIAFNPSKTTQAQDDWKNNGVRVDYNKSKETITTEGHLTSLGADNGTGIAFLLSLAKHHNEFKHGKIRLMFTADESGAVPDISEEEKGWYSGLDYLYATQKEPSVPAEAKPLTDIKYIISLDGNVEGKVFTSVAGLHECQPTRTGIKAETIGQTTDKLHQYYIKVSGLAGGHSAYDINKGYANALQILTQILATDDPNFRIINLTCNNTSPYQICSEASALVVTKYDERLVKRQVETFANVFKSQYPEEVNMSIKYEKKPDPIADTITFPAQLSQEIVVLCSLLAYGPISWYDVDHKIVKSSLNFGPLSITNPTLSNTYNFDFHIVERSADQNELEIFKVLIHNYIKKILPTFKFNDNEIIHTYDPAWEEEDKNPLIDLMVEGYKYFKMGGDRDSSHAWLELSCFPGMYELSGLEKPYMVCIGPTILHSHDVTEQVNTDTFDAMIKGVLYTCEFSHRLQK